MLLLIKQFFNKSSVDNRNTPETADKTKRKQKLVRISLPTGNLC